MSPANDPTGIPRPRRWGRLFMALALLLALLALGLLLVLRYHGLSPTPLGRAAALLTEIEERAALPVRQRGSIDRAGPDGPMPEIASRTLVVAADAATIIARVRAACAAVGLAPADVRRRAIEPEALCDGGPGRVGQSVHLGLECGRTCAAHLQTQITGP